MNRLFSTQMADPDNPFRRAYECGVEKCKQPLHHPTSKWGSPWCIHHRNVCTVDDCGERIHQDDARCVKHETETDDKKRDVPTL